MPEFDRRKLMEAYGNPQQTRELFQEVHESGEEIDDFFLDMALGIPFFHEGLQFEGKQYSNVFVRSFDYIYEGSDYETIRKIMHFLKPTEEDVIYDIGSGYGRFALYGALTTKATLKGVEFVKNRVVMAERIKRRLKQENVSFVNGDAAKTDMSDGTIFYMYNPFWPDGHAAQFAVENNLRIISDTKPITVVASQMNPRVPRFDSADGIPFPKMWPDRFRLIGEIDTDKGEIQVFRSSPQES